MTTLLAVVLVPKCSGDGRLCCDVLFTGAAEDYFTVLQSWRIEAHNLLEIVKAVVTVYKVLYTHCSAVNVTGTIGSTREPSSNKRARRGCTV